ncbi:tripartite tricarboxylate transporter substrate binding protein [Oceanobacillus jeddahense]|uniref:tripartite tricarboxylate transporter substrate binding protein n=1 Tax=Oceanobacillus jeddahense TaxID=1462527 RepID=UPI0005958D5A|nr:tripartite tricarboxylate transporter substrate binding protein [Oceanobacillus jeddahense]
MNKKSMLNKLFILGIISLMILFLYACGSNSGSNGDEASNFPEDSIDIIVAFSAGGSNDSIARMLAESSEDIIGESIIVENQEGGSGSVGQSAGASADPDGYTLTLVTASIVSNPLFNDLPYTHESFEPVILINDDPQYLVINTDAPFDDMESFIAYAEENPGEVTIGVSGAQTTNAFASRELADELGLDIVTLPHDGTADSIVALQGNHIDAVVASYNEFQGQMQSGELTPILNFAGEERNPRTSDVPTALELGYDVDYSSWRGVAAPEGTDPEIIEYLHDSFKEAMETEEFKDSMENLGLDIDYASPEEFQKIIDLTYENYEQFAD